MENVQYIMNRPDFASLSPVKVWILRGNDRCTATFRSAWCSTAEVGFRFRTRV